MSLFMNSSEKKIPPADFHFSLFPRRLFGKKDISLLLEEVVRVNFYQKIGHRAFLTMSDNVDN